MLTFRIARFLLSCTSNYCSRRTNLASTEISRLTGSFVRRITHYVWAVFNLIVNLVFSYINASVAGQFFVSLLLVRCWRYVYCHRSCLCVRIYVLSDIVFCTAIGPYRRTCEQLQFVVLKIMAVEIL